MVDKIYQRMHMPSELEQPQLSTDLEWMLSSSQVGQEFILETLVRGSYASLRRLALILLRHESAAEQVVQETIIGAIRNRHRYRSQTRAEIWLFQLLLESGQRYMDTHAGHYKQPASLHGEPGWIQFRHAEDLDQALVEFGYRPRLLVCLHYLFGLSAAEIAQVLGSEEKAIQAQLLEARTWLRLSRPEAVLDGDAAEEWVRLTLQRRWPQRDLDEGEQEGRIAVCMRRLEEGDRTKRRMRLVQQSLSTVLILAVVAAAGWMSNRIMRTRPEAAGRASSPTALVQAERSPLTTPTGSSLPTIPPTLTPLDLSTSIEDIRQRMFISRSLWKQVWVDALLIRYGPPGYSGPALVYRNQMWIGNPGQEDPTERLLVLSGLVYDDPIYVLYAQGQDVYTVDMRSSMQFAHPRGDANPIYDLASPVHQGMYGYDQRGMLDGSYLSDMLFSAGLVSEFSNLEIIERNQYLDREILILNNVLKNGFSERLMVDTQTGMVLSWMGYLTSDPNTVLAEIIVLNLEYEAAFPVGVSSASSFWSEPVTWVNRGESLQMEPFSARALSSALLRVDSNTARPRIPQRIPPPPAYDPSNSCLTFQWSEESASGGDGISPAEVYADGYFLGEALLSNPWQTLCERSASGGRIACLEIPQGLRSRLYAPSRLSWFELSNPAERHDVLPEAQVMSSDFAFSPDNRYLALWACLERGEDCGVYIHDTQTHENTAVTALERGATFFVWSPDGKYLAFVGAGANLQYASSLLVVEVETGKIMDEEAFLWPEMSLPVDSPVRDWGLNFPPEQGEFEACNPSR